MNCATHRCTILAKCFIIRGRRAAPPVNAGCDGKTQCAQAGCDGKTQCAQAGVMGSLSVHKLGVMGRHSVHKLV